MLKIPRGASKRFEYTAPLAELDALDPLKTDGLLTDGFTLRMVVRDSKTSTVNRILKTSANPAQIEIVSSTLAYVYFVPSDTASIAIPDAEDGITLWYGFGIDNGSTKFAITPFSELRVTRSLV